MMNSNCKIFSSLARNTFNNEIKSLLGCSQNILKLKSIPSCLSVHKKYQRNMSSSTSPYALAALKTKGIEKSVWVDFIQLALEVKPLNLGQGFPDFAAPDTIRKALAECCTDDENVLFNQYTRGFGHPRLCTAISNLYSKLLGRTLDSQNEVLVTAGAYEALFVTINGLVNPGDEVIIIEPFFDCYEPQVKLAGELLSSYL